MGVDALQIALANAGQPLSSPMLAYLLAGPLVSRREHRALQRVLTRGARGVYASCVAHQATRKGDPIIWAWPQ